MADIPEGFAPHPRRSALTAPWEPIYAHHTADAIILALRAGTAHTNSRGFVHGGLMCALADNAMGLSCGMAMPQTGGLVTVSLSIDFLSPAKIGQWLSFNTSFVKRGGTLCFVQCFVQADNTVCARANATFRVLADAR